MNLRDKFSSSGLLVVKLKVVKRQLRIIVRFFGKKEFNLCLENHLHLLEPQDRTFHSTFILSPFHGW